MAGDPILGNKIKQLRQRMRLTQAELGGTDFTKSFISQIEKGQTRPSLKSLRIIAARLNQPLSFFLDDEPEMTVSIKPELLLIVDAGNTYHAQGRLEEAIEQYEKSLTQCSPSDHRLKSDVYYRLAHAYNGLGQADRAIDLYLLSAEESSRANAHEMYISSRHKLALIFWHLGDYINAERSLKKALLTLPKLSVPPSELKLSLLWLLAEVLCGLNHFDKAYETLKEAIHLSRTNESHSYFGNLCRTMGHVCTRLGKLDEGAQYTEKAIIAAQLVENQTSYLLACIDREVQKRKRGDKDDALQGLRHIATEAQAASDPKVASLALGELAQIYWADGLMQEAVDAIEQALLLDPYSNSLIRWLKLLTECISQISLSPSLQRHIESMPAKWPKSRRALAEFHGALGELFLRMNEPALANHHFKQSVALFKSVS